MDADAAVRGPGDGSVVIVVAGPQLSADESFLEAVDLIVGVVVLHESTHEELESLDHHCRELGHPLDGILSLRSACIGVRGDVVPDVAAATPVGSP